MSKINGFPPILPSLPKILILGSMPSIQSLQRQQYYANPQNAFWKIMSSLLGFANDIPYQQRTVALRQANIALWDVLKSCERDGSLDTAIVPVSEKPNAIAEMLNQKTSIIAVFFNGKTSAKLFSRHLQINPPPEIFELPSTSPAHARLTLEQKITAWGKILNYLQ